MAEKIVANNLYELLDDIQKWPGVLLGGKSISRLYYFIRGYNTACDLKSINENLKPDIGNFHDFVNDYYLHGPSTAGWKNVILAEHYGDEIAAFDDFFKLFDLFKNGYPRINYRKIIIGLIRKMINEANCISIIDDALIIDYLKNLPLRLEDGQSLYDYYAMLCDLRKMAAGNKALSSLVSEANGSDSWLEIFELM